MNHEGAYAAREGDGEALRGTGDEGAQSPYATQEGDGEALGGTGAHEHNAIRRT